MIGFLAGKIVENQDGKVLVSMSLGEKSNGGGVIGYAVQVPASPSYDALVPGTYAEFFVHTHVREDAFDLIGFLTREEKEIFLILLTVNGIGPKGALGILSKVELATLIEAVLDGDKDRLTEVPGIGKKTAERIVLELADPLRKKMEAGALPQEWLIAKTIPVNTEASRSATGKIIAHSKLFKEAKEALTSLGYREQEIAGALKRLQEAEAQEFRKTEEIVKLALKELM